MFYSGIDQHKRDSFITTYDDRGAIVKQERVPNTPLAMQRYFAQFAGPSQCGRRIHIKRLARIGDSIIHCSIRTSDRSSVVELSIRNGESVLR